MQNKNTHPNLKFYFYYNRNKKIELENLFGIIKNTLKYYSKFHHLSEFFLESCNVLWITLS